MFLVEEWSRRWLPIARSTLRSSLSPALRSLVMAFAMRVVKINDYSSPHSDQRLTIFSSRQTAAQWRVGQTRAGSLGLTMIVSSLCERSS